MLSRAHENKLRWIVDEPTRLKARRWLIRQLAQRTRLVGEGYRLCMRHGHLWLSCTQCGWRRRWPVPLTWRQSHRSVHI